MEMAWHNNERVDYEMIFLSIVIDIRDEQITITGLREDLRKIHNRCGDEILRFGPER